MIQSNAFESNASANANADESNANASANASAAKESSASANANAAFALAFANASAFEHKPGGLSTAELELEFYLFDRQLHNIGEIISKCEIILSGDSHKGTNWPLT